MDRDFAASWELLVALSTASLILVFFEVVFVILLEPLGVDVELKICPSDPQKP